MNWRELLARINGGLWALDADHAGLLEGRIMRARDGARAAMAETTTQPKPYGMAGSVAVIPVQGLIMPKADYWFDPSSETALDYLRSSFKMALADAGVSAIAFYVDSPGGSAMGVDEMSAEIFAARGQKPIGAFTAHGLCASAAYYLASAVDPGSFWSTGTSLNGSIGVITTHFDYSAAYKEYGITPTVLTYGARKGDGNPYEKLSAESRASIQARINDFGQLFEGAVARNRGIDAKEVRAKFGQGQVFVGHVAKQRGMIDAVGDWEGFLAHMAGGSQTKTKPNAGANAASVSLPAAAAPAPQLLKGSKMNPKIKAALFARGMIDSLEATDAECKAALAGFYRGSVPEGDKAILEGLNGTAAVIAAAAEPLKPAANVQAARDNEVAELRAELEREANTKANARVVAVQTCGAKFGMSAEVISAGVASGKPLDTLVAEWTAERAATEQPVSRAHVSVNETGAAAFERDASHALQLRLNANMGGVKVSADAERLRRAPMAELARQSLELAGIRTDMYASDREDIIRQALEAEGGRKFTIGASGGPVNRPGSFPNLLSNLANKLLDDAIELAAPSYPEWTGVWPSDLPDFKPSPVVNKSRHDELDQVLDAEAYKEFGLAEEMLSYMQLQRYGNKFSLTPVMLANDDLGAFAEDMLGLGEALENTTNRLCLGLITGNGSLLDGGALYNSTAVTSAGGHANLITSTGNAAPGVTPWDAMQQLAGAQRGVGGKGYVRTPLALCLIPPALRVAAMQAFSPMNGFAEVKSPVTDATLNPFRGTVKVVVEPELQAASNVVWYGFADPRMRATVVRAYFRGYGPSGKRERWYDMSNACWNFSIEHRVGAAVKNYRYTVRNPGQ